MVISKITHKLAIQTYQIVFMYIVVCVHVCNNN